MSDVQRYFCDATGHITREDDGRFVAPAGTYVDAEDYDALTRRIAELEQEVEKEAAVRERYVAKVRGVAAALGKRTPDDVEDTLHDVVERVALLVKDRDEFQGTFLGAIHQLNVTGRLRIQTSDELEEARKRIAELEAARAEQSEEHEARLLLEARVRDQEAKISEQAKHIARLEQSRADLRREHDEDQGVIAVWRGRTERAEAALEAERERLDFVTAKIVMKLDVGNGKHIYSRAPWDHDLWRHLAHYEEPDARRALRAAVDQARKEEAGG